MRLLLIINFLFQLPSLGSGIRKFFHNMHILLIILLRLARKSGSFITKFTISRSLACFLWLLYKKIVLFSNTKKPP